MQLYKYLEIEEKNRFNSKSNDVKLRKIKNENTLPFEYVELQLCKLFNCLPSQLKNEDYSHLMRLLSLDNAIETYKSWLNDDSKLATPLRIHLEILKLEKALENAK